MIGGENRKIARLVFRNASRHVQHAGRPGSEKFHEAHQRKHSGVNQLESQRDALSGVSMDEEAVNMIQQQRAYQASARFITAVDQMMQTLLQM